MTFPLSKEEHDFLDSVEEILNHSNGVAFSEYELTRYSDLITLMKAKHVLIDTSSFDGIQFTLTGSFKAFQDWIKAEEEKYITANNMLNSSKNDKPENNSALDVISNLIQKNLRKMIHNKPQKEIEVQNEIENIFVTNDWQKGVDFDRESGKVEFSGKEFIPDFNFLKINLCVEVKLVREGKQNKIVEEICSDISGYSKKYDKLLFVVYDLGIIRDVDQFTYDIENSRKDVLIKTIVIKH